MSRTKLTLDRVSLSMLAEQMAETLRGTAPARQVEFRIAPDLVVDGDPELMRIALWSLLENAWKFTSKREHATIELGASEVGDARCYFVRDDGAGFVMAYASKLFLAFQRLHPMTEFAGTGIGLASVERVIQRHGGRVWAESAVNEEPRFLSLSPRRGHMGAQPTGSKARAILLVEDNPDDEMLTLRALAKNNILNEVVVARDGVEAIDALFGAGPFAPAGRLGLPQVVLLDLKLPKIDGAGALRKIRSEERTRYLPVVILTSSNEDRDLIESYALGANSYVRKPVDFVAFVEAVRALGLYWLVLNEPAPR